MTVSAHYRTDSMHYAYLDDEGCEATLQMGYEVPERDASVADFEGAESRICVETGRPYLCVLEGKLTLRGEIVWIKGAHLEPDIQTLAINPHSVVTFEFTGTSASGR